MTSKQKAHQAAIDAARAAWGRSAPGSEGRHIANKLIGDLINKSGKEGR